MSRAPIGIAESVRKVDGETIATVRLGAPTDADVETLRRAMVDAWQTWRSLIQMSSIDLGDDGYRVSAAASDAYQEAARAYVAAKRARGGL